MEIFLLFTLAHLCADYPLQFAWVYRWKYASLIGGLAHAGILALCHAFFLFPYLDHPQLAWGISILVSLHFLQDYLKILIFDRRNWQIFAGYLLDQVLHLLSFSALTLLALYYFQPNLTANTNQIFFWHQPLFVSFAILLIIGSFAYDITRYTWRRTAQPTLTYQKDWRGILTRSAVISILFWGGYFLLQSLEIII